MGKRQAKTGDRVTAPGGDAVMGASENRPEMGASGHAADMPDLFHLTRLERFSVLPGPHIHVQGHPETLQPIERLVDPWATARGHPDFGIINEAAYAARIVLYRVRQALEVANKKSRTDEEKNELHATVKALKAVATAMQDRKLYPRLAPADTWSADAKPAALIDMWMEVLPQISAAASAAAGKRKIGVDDIRGVLERCELQPWPNIPTYPSTARELLQVATVIANVAAIKAIHAWCYKPRARRNVAFSVVSTILGDGATANSVRLARDRYKVNLKKTGKN